MTLLNVSHTPAEEFYDNCVWVSDCGLSKQVVKAKLLFVAATHEMSYCHYCSCILFTHVCKKGWATNLKSFFVSVIKSKSEYQR